jgi:hypothetical protein
METSITMSQLKNKTKPRTQNIYTHAHIHIRLAATWQLP